MQPAFATAEAGQHERDPEPPGAAAELLSDPARGWRRMIRIDTSGGDVGEVIQATNDHLPERLVYAEGDSWFDKLRPLPLAGANLLDAIRTPFVSAVVDVSHIGDELRDMVRGHQARQTQAMFKLFSFQAILLSAGGNDLKNLFAELFATQAERLAGFRSPHQTERLDGLARPAGGALFAGTRIGRGPWLYPVLQAAGLSDAEMRAAAASASSSA